MTVVLILLATLLGIAAAGSGIQKLRRDRRVMESMRAVGVADQVVPVLAILEIAGALGLVLGIWIPWIGIAASIGLALYFLGAVLSHLRVRASFGEAMPAVIILVLAIATSILQVLR